jgi:hypothetical protein
MADRKERSQLVGDFLREAAVLIMVTLPLEDAVTHENKMNLNVILFAVLFGGLLLYLGIILEGRDEL